jgi:hypothetical protein
MSKCPKCGAVLGSKVVRHYCKVSGTVSKPRPPKVIDTSFRAFVQNYMGEATV